MILSFNADEQRSAAPRLHRSTRVDDFFILSPIISIGLHFISTADLTIQRETLCEDDTSYRILLLNRLTA